MGNNELDHGFHETPQGLRYTLSEPARREVLARLLELNHARYAEEVKAGLHGKGKGKKADGSKKVAEGQLGLFGGVGAFVSTPVIVVWKDMYQGWDYNSTSEKNSVQLASLLL